MSAALLSLWALTAAGFSALTAWKLCRTSPSPQRGEGRGEGGIQPGLHPAPDVLLLRPLDAPTAHELSCLAHPLTWPGRLEHVVVSPFRPRLAPGVRWLPSEPLTPNRKVGHLTYALAVLGGEGRVVLCIDSDVAVTEELVAALAAPLQQGAALTTAAPLPQPGGGLAGLLQRGLLGHTHHSFVALDAMRAGAPAICGKALGLSPAAAQALSGLGHHLGEDLELALRLHARGAQVVRVEVPAPMPAAEGASLATVLARFTRWMQVLRAHRPRLYPTVPLLFAPTLPLLALLALSPSRPLAASLLVLVGVRALLSLVLAHKGGGVRRQAPWLWLAGEGLLLAAFVRSLLAPTVRWRGHTFHLGTGGTLRPAGSAAREAA